MRTYSKDPVWRYGGLGRIVQQTHYCGGICSLIVEEILREIQSKSKQRKE
jgi:hypothetical protein